MSSTHKLWVDHDRVRGLVTDVLSFHPAIDPDERVVVTPPYGDAYVERLSTLARQTPHAAVLVGGTQHIVPVSSLRVIPDDRPVECRRGVERPGLRDHDPHSWHQDGRVRVDVVDDPRHPDGATRYGRSIMAGPFQGEFNVTVSLYDHEPREWPPMHVGCVTAGIGLDVGQATLLRDALNEWLSETPIPEPT